MLRLGLTLLLFCSSALAAEPPHHCEHSFHSASASLTAEEAQAIVGQGSAKERYQAAMNFVLPRPFSSVEQMTHQMESLFEAVKAAGKWDFRKVILPNGSTVFLGSLGHGLLIEPTGRVSSGSFPMRLFKDGIWKDSYQIEDQKMLRQHL